MAANRKLQIPIEKALHEDLFIDILSRLPPKYVTSICSLVSKSWYHSTKKVFLFRHSKAALSKTINLFFKHEMNLNLVSFDVVPRTCSSSSVVALQGQRVTIPRYVHRFCHFSNATDGIICLFDYNRGNTICVMNLRTLDFFLVPNPKLETNFDVFYSWCCLGFDPIRNEYKIVRVTSGKDVNWWNTYEKFTLGRSKSWERIQHGHVPPRLREGSLEFGLSTNSFCLEGVVYWMQINSTKLEVFNSIVALSVRGDQEDNNFRAFDLEQVIGQRPYVHHMDYYLTHLRGNPTLFFAKKGSDDMCQATLLDHTNPNSTWTLTAKFTTQFLKVVMPRRRGSIFVGGNIFIKIKSVSGFEWTSYSYEFENVYDDGIYVWELIVSPTSKLVCNMKNLIS